MLSANQIRDLFFEFFVEEGHRLIPSAPLVPKTDPTLIFVNSGMVQFKNIFLGMETPEFKCAVSSQKCMRAGGKHNDLENVGYTTRHHTFFEMLGNFSFGDYFKERAIELAWRFITEQLMLQKEKLYVTYYYQDLETAKLWKKIAVGLADERIIPIKTEDNFWSMGPTGPCGPCTEIFYDHGPKHTGELSKSCNNPDARFIEIWNLVFMQYDRAENQELNNLPKPCVDTGMGLERIAAVMQNKHDNYDADLFKDIMDKSMALSGLKGDKYAASHKIVADHLRASVFLVADGVMPSNEGREYVLRRIMRRCMVHADRLKIADRFVEVLLPEILEKMGEAYPEIIKAASLVKETFRLEGEVFIATLERGMRFLRQAINNLRQGSTLPGKDIFKLYDTYGFPLETTKEILSEYGIKLDLVGFEAEMAVQKSRGRQSWMTIPKNVLPRIACNPTVFVGYTQTETRCQITEIMHGVADPGFIDTKIAVLDKTPFYAESGGQLADQGELLNENNQVLAVVTDVQKTENNIYLHHVQAKRQIISGEKVIAKVDLTRREKLKANHSATHLLHAALREILGDHVTQKGSLVAEEYLRFDFSHAKLLSREETENIEDRANQIIRENARAITEIKSKDAAIRQGALSLFGEKYGDEVRVVAMGNDNFSLELCGGTHVGRTGDIGLFKIISCETIASGIKRIEALTGQNALTYLRNQILALSNDKKSLEEKYSKLQKENRAQQQQVLSMEINGIEGKKIGDITLISKVFKDIGIKELHTAAINRRNRSTASIIILFSTFGKTVNFIIAITKDIAGEKLNAAELVAMANQIVGGKGGGKPDFAQGGGKEASKISEVIIKLEQYLKKM